MRVSRMNEEKLRLTEMTAEDFLHDYCKDNIESIDTLKVAQLGFNLGIAEEENRDSFTNNGKSCTREDFTKEVAKLTMQKKKDKELVIERLAEFLFGYGHQLRAREEWEDEKSKNKFTTKKRIYDNRRKDLIIDNASIKELSRKIATYFK